MPVSCLIIAFSAAQSAPINRLISTCQPVDQHLSAALSAPISCLISTCQHVDQYLSAASLVTVRQLISNCQPLDHLMRRTDSFEKTLMLGKMEGRRRRGRQRMRWLDGITDSMDMGLVRTEGHTPGIRASQESSAPGTRGAKG